ncbi:GGDEF domain-containing response regulator, partial [Pseudomonas sp. FW305-BF6]|uniref:EAL domain-containing protein n=2 Tax=Pseudomonas TaxID=286 RepID=UPI000CAE6227
ITEGVLMQNVDATMVALSRLKALGVRLAIDDFGTGYSSLSYLQRFPIDVLKIDQSFIRGLGRDSNDAALVGAIISLGKSLNLTVIAEGVE